MSSRATPLRLTSRCKHTHAPAQTHTHTHTRCINNLFVSKSATLLESGLNFYILTFPAGAASLGQSSSYHRNRVQSVCSSRRTKGGASTQKLSGKQTQELLADGARCCTTVHVCISAPSIRSLFKQKLCRTSVSTILCFLKDENLLSTELDEQLCPASSSPLAENGQMSELLLVTSYIWCEFSS